MQGFYVIEDFIDPEEEELLLKAIDSYTWSTNRSGTRRVQIYGPKHDSKYRILRHETPRAIPEEIKGLTERLKEVTPSHLRPLLNKLGHDASTEIFINEYLRYDALQFHHDNRVTYKEPIFGISMCCDSTLTFRDARGEYDYYIPRYSLYIMSAESRYVMKHGIRSGSIDGERRVSITYRLI